MNLPYAIERLRDVLRRQHKSLSTEDSYVYWLRHYVTALNTMPGSLTSEQKLENFLTSLARNRDLAASTQNQAFNAILFFYNEVIRQPLQNIDALRATRPARLRHPNCHGTQLAGDYHGLLARGKLERTESVGIDPGWKDPPISSAPMVTRAPHLHVSDEKVHFHHRQELYRHFQCRVNHSDDVGSRLISPISPVPNARRTKYFLESWRLPFR